MQFANLLHQHARHNFHQICKTNHKKKTICHIIFTKCNKTQSKKFVQLFYAPLSIISVKLNFASKKSLKNKNCASIFKKLFTPDYLLHFANHKSPNHMHAFVCHPWPHDVVWFPLAFYRLFCFCYCVSDFGLPFVFSLPPGFMASSRVGQSLRASLTAVFKAAFWGLSARKAWRWC